LDIAQRLQEDGQSEEGTVADLCARWRRRGLRAFDADKEAAGAEVNAPEAGRAAGNGGAGVISACSLPLRLAGR
jgi:hypothetical protein